MKAYSFKNDFFFMRHGESLANRNGIIVSSAEIGVSDYGLTGQGVNDVAEKAVSSRFDSNLRIVSSDFLRTQQTAQIIAEVVDSSYLEFSSALRERYFGDLDGLSDTNYPVVWQLDKQGKKKFNVESLASVLHRMLSCVWELESQFENQTFLLISHGDCLQILISWLQGLSPTQHRSVLAIKPAAIRAVNNQQSIQNILNQLNLDIEDAA